MTSKKKSFEDIPIDKEANKEVVTEKLSRGEIEKHRTPKYIQLATELKQLIHSEYKVGDSLPSESKLADDFGVNRHTIHRAINELAIEGYLNCQQGKRAEILERHPIKYALDIGKFTAGMNRLGKQSTTQILSVETKLKVPKNIKDLFYYSSNSSSIDTNLYCDLNRVEKNEFILIKTLRLVEDEPVTIIDHYLNPKYISDITEYYHTGSLHDCIKKYYGLNLKRVNTHISSRLPNSIESAYLKCHSAQPLLILRTVNCDKNDLNKVVEVSFSHTRADKMVINI